MSPDSSIATAIGVGGTFTTLATLSLRLPYRTSAQGEVLSRADVELVVHRLARLTIAETAARTADNTDMKLARLAKLLASSFELPTLVSPLAISELLIN